MMETKGLTVEMWPIDRPIDYKQNARKWSGRAIEVVASSIREYGFRQPVVVDKDGVIIIGHLRRRAARELGLTEVPVHVADNLTPEQTRGLRLADNRSSQESDWDEALLPVELTDLSALGFDLSLTGFTAEELDRLMGAPAAGDEPGAAGKSATLAERFGVPPFSVLDARQGYWQERKRAWLSLGIQSELGRGGLMEWAQPSPERAELQQSTAAAPASSTRMAMHNDPMQRKRAYAAQ